MLKKNKMKKIIQQKNLSLLRKEIKKIKLNKIIKGNKRKILLQKIQKIKRREDYHFKMQKNIDYKQLI